MSTPAETLDATTTLGSADTSSSLRDAPVEALTKGDSMGRYVVLRRIGMGGMGAVYLAYDPELDRKVALKLLRGSAKTVDSRLLLREAQAMAKLQHPNVVTVHDVGEHEGRVYVAMEFVEGVTLREWVGARPRRWQDVVELLTYAAEGLLAAHARGLVHRDFKPDNVMVSDAGHVAVMDFGLAWPSREVVVDEEVDEEVEASSVRGSLLNTETRQRRGGTPAYMAPEQAMAQEPTEAVDQFAFCVSAWECLFGQRPFEGTTIGQRLANVVAREVRPVPPGRRVPGWLEQVLRRGIEPQPEDRWPSMAALLNAIAQGHRRRRWRVGLVAVGVVAAAVAGAWGWQQQRERQRHQAIAACDAKGAVIDELWNDGARERMRAGLLGTGAPFAESSLEILIPWLDDYRDAWSSGRAAACRHGSIERDWDASLLDRSSWCFEDRRLQLEATVEQLSTLQLASARRAVRIASYLDPIDSCLDPNLLQRLPVPPPAMRDEIRAIRVTLNESDRLRHAGHYAEAYDIAQQARAEAESLGWPPLLALARFIEGRCSSDAGNSAAAEATLMSAYFEAQEAGSSEVAFRAARSLMIVLLRLQRYREAELWSRHADVLSSELVDPRGLDAAERHHLLIGIYEEQGELEAAAWEGEQAIEMRTVALGPQHPITAASTRSLGRVYLAQGRLGAALELLEEANAVWATAVEPNHPYMAHLATLRGEALFRQGYIDRGLVRLGEGADASREVLGEAHPQTAGSMERLAQALLQAGRIDEAERAIGGVMEQRRRTVGPRHRKFARSLLLMSAVDRHRGNHAVALQRCEQAAEVLESVHGPLSSALAPVSDCMAKAYASAGRTGEAVRYRRRALAQHEDGHGSDSHRLVGPWVQLGDALRHDGQLDHARGFYERAKESALRDESGGTRYALAASLVGLTEVGLQQADRVAALAWAEQAVRLVDEHALGPRAAGPAHFALARALPATDARARAMAMRAQDDFATLHDALGSAEVKRWLAAPGDD